MTLLAKKLLDFHPQMSNGILFKDVLSTYTVLTKNCRETAKKYIRDRDPFPLRKWITTKIKFSSRWKCEWKSSDEMGPRILRQPKLRKIDLPWNGRSVSRLINIHSSIKATHESIKEIHNSNIDVYNSVMDVHNSVMYIHNPVTDIHTCGEIIMDSHDWIMDVNN